ncbi:hypothetical protein JOB18_024452 [Solea senegalensis]|uniref:Uncharacterized protein n=1 Tax=Solea senegalensis TaxID=28829 RepID=A0AAV6R813_SOLSE|nr:hypothetical protein JOB18_024452 [Solea senegalensis]
MFAAQSLGTSFTVSFLNSKSSKEEPHEKPVVASSHQRRNIASALTSHTPSSANYPSNAIRLSRFPRSFKQTELRNGPEAFRPQGGGESRGERGMCLARLKTCRLASQVSLSVVMWEARLHYQESWYGPESDEVAFNMQHAHHFRRVPAFSEPLQEDVSGTARCRQDAGVTRTHAAAGTRWRERVNNLGTEFRQLHQREAENSKQRILHTQRKNFPSFSLFGLMLRRGDVGKLLMLTSISVAAEWEDPCFDPEITEEVETQKKKKMLCQMKELAAAAS